MPEQGEGKDVNGMELVVAKTCATWPSSAMPGAPWALLPKQLFLVIEFFIIPSPDYSILSVRPANPECFWA